MLLVAALIAVTILALRMKKKNEEFKAAKAKEEHEKAVQAAFIANASHDLRTPLNGVTGYTALALKATTLQKKQEYLESITSCNALLTGLVIDILDLPRLDSGKMSLIPETMDPLKAYQDVIMTGSGKRRWTYEQVSSLLLPRIQKANVELNTKEMINCALDRFVFKGSNGRVISADFVLFGGSKFGSLYSQEEIRLAATHKHYSYSRALHFGPLLIQPYLRDVRGKSGNQSKRETLQAKWHYMQSDLEQSIEKSNRDAPVQ